MKKATLKVDMNRREQLRRLHTATHIINHCAKKVLGNHVWQNGSNLKPEVGTLDITHYDTVTLDQIFEIEQLANSTVFENKKVTIEELERGKAERKYGFTLYQGGAIPQTTIRVIHIEDSDIEACGGLHMQTTGGIGLIKIIDAQKIQDGVVRLSYVVREFALQFIEEEQKIIKEIQSVYTVQHEAVAKSAVKFFNEWKEQKKEIDKLKDELKMTHIQTFLDSKEHEFSLKGAFDMGYVMEVFTSVHKQKKKLKLETQNFIVATQDYDIKDVKKSIPKGSFTMHIK